MSDATPNLSPLTLFEGHQVVETTVKVTGTIKHHWFKPARDLRQGETVTVVATFKVGKIAFPPADDGCTREQTLEAMELHEIATGDFDVRRLLADARAKTRRDVETRYPAVKAGEGITVSIARALSPEDEARAARERMRSVSRDDDRDDEAVAE